MLKHIVCAVDLSPASESVVNRAKHIVQLTKSSISLVHCIEKHQMDFIKFIIKTTEKAEHLMLNEAQSKISALKQQFPDQNNVTIVLSAGNIADCISQTVETTQANMTILGTSDKSGLQRAFLGSNALKVLRRSTCPILIIKNQALHHYQRILIGVDLAQDITPTVKFLQFIAPDAEIVLAHCYEIPFEGKLNHHAEFNDVHLLAYRTEIRAHALKKMQMIVDQAKLDPLKLTTVVTQGDPADTLLQLAKDHACDLIALNKNSLTALDDWLLGSVTNEIVNTSTLDILVLDQKRSQP